MSSYNSKLRRKAMLVIGDGGIKCCRCGVSDEELIEINHRYGDGKRDRIKTLGENAYYRMLKDIVHNKRRKDEFDLRCKVCNVAHYIWLKFGIEYKVFWRKVEPECGRCSDHCEHNS